VQGALPPRPILLELSTPSADGDIAALRPAPRLPPDPDRHTLDVGPAPRFFGDLASHTPQVECTVETVRRTQHDEERSAVTERVPWDINKSVFAPRRRESDARDYYNHAKVVGQQFEQDWKRLTTKQRFGGFVEREAKKSAAAEGRTAGRGLHSSTFRHNVSAFCGIGVAFRGCLGVV